ncbi:MAG: hypothetical protein WAT91_10705 [Saprospiraceae bacterium]
MMNQSSTSSKEVKLMLDVNLFKEGDYIVAYCPALELSTYGTDEKDAKVAFKDAVQIFLTETFRKGTLEKELLKLGWRLQLKPTALFEPPKNDLAASKIRGGFNTTKMPILMPVS